MFSKIELQNLYTRDQKSAKEIALIFFCSENKIHYWLKKYGIQKRSISAATYIKANPRGNPFEFKHPDSPETWFLFGLGLGLYWGEGNKANTHAIRLGNTDPDLIKTFLHFLKKIYNIDLERLKFGLQIFSDIEPDKALAFWTKKLNVPRSKFYKVTLSNLNRKGTYLKKSKYGVLTIYFSNTKLRDTIVSAIDELRNSTLSLKEKSFN